MSSLLYWFQKIIFCKFLVRTLGPGPGAYNPEKCPPMNHSQRSPAYSLKGRISTKYEQSGPGPNSYTVPSCLGPHIPDKRAFGAFTMYLK